MPNETPSLNRRDFLATSAAGVLSAVAFCGDNLCFSSEGWANQESFQRPFSFWYLSGSQDLSPQDLASGLQLTAGGKECETGGNEGPAFRWVNATSLRRGNMQFAGKRARVLIHGFLCPERSMIPSSLVSFAIDLDYRPNHPVFYHAWRHENRGVLNAGRPTVFHAPIDADFGLNLQVTMETIGASGSMTQKSFVWLALNEEPDEAKLQRGLYLLRYRPESWNAADLVPPVLMGVDYDAESPALFA
jgi:hypothetical protein